MQSPRKSGHIPYKSVPLSLVTGPDYKIVLEPGAQTILSRCASDTRFASSGSFTYSTQGLAASRFERHPAPNSEDWYPFLARGQVYRYQLKVEDIDFADMTEHPTLTRFYEAMPKILIRRVVNRQDRLMATYYDDKLVFKKDVNPFVIADRNWNGKLVLAILNSRLISYLYVNTSAIATKDDFRQTTLAELRRLPFPRISPDAAESLRMIALAEQALALREQVAESRVPQERLRLERRAEEIDRQIDMLVYGLYDLSQAEIAVIEGDSAEDKRGGSESG